MTQGEPSKTVFRESGILLRQVVSSLCFLVFLFGKRVSGDGLPTGGLNIRKDSVMSSCTSIVCGSHQARLPGRAPCTPGHSLPWFQGGDSSFHLAIAQAISSLLVVGPQMAAGPLARDNTI